MSAGSTFFVLIPAMYGIFSLSLALIALADRRLPAARWASLGFLIACISITIDGYRDHTQMDWWPWLSVTSHFFALLTMIQAFASRHQMRVSALAIVVSIVGSLIVMPDVPWAPPYWLRAIAVQAIGAAIILSAMPIMWSRRQSSAIDQIAFYVIASACLAYAARAVFAMLNPVGQSTEALTEFYATIAMMFHLTSAVTGMLVGIVLMMSIGYDMLRSRIEETEVDPLTKLGNRRRLDRLIADDDEAGGTKIGAVIVVDLDHFKKVNDLYGHEAGDVVLQQVSARLTSLLGPFGEVCRTGGEEFVAVVGHDFAPGTSALALAVREAVSTMTFDAPLAQATITASVGFHRRTPNVEVKQAIHRADQAVYCAKADGRNRVVAATSEGGLQVLKAVA
ncbi:MAG: GGDEF domain-containing protein [Erythrobacter sp.]|nr:GGDEF domain-containing protein [Erythrobacter sp.]